MSDNVPITAGAGTTISTEEVTTLNGGAVSAQHVQRVSWARRTADGTAVDWSAGTSSRASVTASTASQTLHAANASRIAIIIFNAGTAPLYVLYGTTASTSAFSYMLDMNEGYREEVYTGRIDGIWTSSGGFASITELQP